MDDPLPDVLARFGVIADAPPTLIGAGTLNFNYFVRTARGAFVLRRIRDDQPDAQVALEHETIRWIAARRLPVATPVVPANDPSRPFDDELPPTCIRSEFQSSSDATEQSRWALFPFLSGRRVARGTLTSIEVTALGDMHGRLHAVLRDHPRSTDARFDMQWSVEQSAATLERIETAARSDHASAVALEGIALQRRLLDRIDVRPPSAFAVLPCQWLHGDYHVEQVLFDADSRVSAILDWELCQANARAWELVRSLAFSGLLGDDRAAAYVHAYRRHVAIRRAELELGMRLWWQSRLVGVWVWWAAFVQGNRRVHAFIPETVATLRSISETGWCERVTREILRAVQE